MAESGELRCESCQYNNVNKSASMWCTDCEEAFCSECCNSHKAARTSRKHLIITAGMYQEQTKYYVNLVCPHHGKQLDIYCPTHDSVVCLKCVQLNHANCNDLKKLNEAASCANTSETFTELAKTIDGLLTKIEEGVQDLQQNKTYLAEQEDVIKTTIATKRAEINTHLDNLQEQLLNALKSKSEEAVNTISLITNELEAKRANILELNVTAQNMKERSSNLKLFVGIRNILKTVVQENPKITQLVSRIPHLSVAVHLNSKLYALSEAFDISGEIQITYNEAVPCFEAQYPRPVDKLDNLKLKLIKEINMGEKNSKVTSCLILRNKSIMIASCNKPSLSILKEDGSHDRDINVPHEPYDVTIIDDHKVAVSYGYRKKCISIVNVNTQNKHQTLDNLCNYGIYGISYNAGKLFVVACREGIKVIDLDGNIIEAIRIYKDAEIYRVTTKMDKIYYSVSNGSVHCVDMKGTQHWKCQLECEWYTSPAISVDNDGITFAAGHRYNKLLAVSPDGGQQKVLLTSSDKLNRPNALYYDQASKQLLVCNGNNGHAALYDVIYE